MLMLVYRCRQCLQVEALPEEVGESDAASGSSMRHDDVDRNEAETRLYPRV